MKSVFVNLKHSTKTINITLMQSIFIKKIKAQKNIWCEMSYLLISHLKHSGSSLLWPCILDYFLFFQKEIIYAHIYYFLNSVVVIIHVSCIFFFFFYLWYILETSHISSNRASLFILVAVEYPFTSISQDFPYQYLKEGL